MLKKTITTTLLTLMMIISFTGIAFGEPIAIKIAHMGNDKPLENSTSAGVFGFKYLMEKGTNGKYEVKSYPRGSLGNQSDVMSALKNNAIQMSMASSAGLFRLFPPASIFFTPYIFKNATIALEVVDGPFGRKLMDAFEEKTGFKALAIYGGYNWMALTNNKRPIKTLDDFKGLKFRVMDTLGAEMFKSLGASGVPIAWTETYSALQTGVVDGQTNPMQFIDSAKFYETQKYLTLAGTQWGYLTLICNKQWYDSLNAKDKMVLNDSIRGSLISFRGITLLNEDKYLKVLKKAGMEINALSAEEMEKFREVAKPACMHWVRKTMGDQWADGLLAAINDAERKLGYK